MFLRRAVHLRWTQWRPVRHCPGTHWLPVPIGSGTSNTKSAVVSLLGELSFVHLGRRSNPQTGGDQLGSIGKQFAGGAEVTDICHTRSDEYFVNLCSSNIT